MIVNKNGVSFEYINIYTLTNKKIGIPIFQRFFDWKVDQTSQLLNDIKDVANNLDKELYLLDFIYYFEDNGNKLMFADGQQRIVTINLLIKVINDYIDNEQLALEKLKLFDISYDIEAYNDKYQCNFTKYICSPFKQIYLHFERFIKENQKNLNDIINVIKNKIFVYIKRCLNADDAFVIFQQINTGGKPLSKDEIIQTAIKQYAEIYGVSIDCKVKDIKIAIVSYYKYLTNDTSKNLDNIGILAFLKTHVTKDKNTFLKFVNTLKNLSTLEKNPITAVFGYINRASLYDLLNVLAMKGIDTNNNREYLENVIIPMCMLSIILSLNGGLPSTLKYLMNDLIIDINNNVDYQKLSLKIATYINNNKASYKINYINFIEALSGRGNATPGIRKALLVLDAIVSNTSGIININKINLEHIYPQKPKTIWASNGWPTDREEQLKLINNIGNQFLLCEKVNKSISNNYIQDKLPKYKLIIQKDALLRTNINTVDFLAFEKRKEEYINERLNKIVENIYESIPFAKVVIEK